MAKKIKVGALAKRLKIDTKELLKVLKDLNVSAKTAASSIDEETAQIVKEVVVPKKEVVTAPIPSVPEKEKVKEEVKAEAEAEAKEGEEPTGPTINSNEITVKDLANLIQAKPSLVIMELMKKGAMANINQQISAEMAKEVAGQLGIQIIVKKPKTAAEVSHDLNIEQLVHRPPIVTIMGHVDHGKTKLLDVIRKSRVAEGEAGGITQHIGAYQVEVHGKKVTFLDTPGHEAFTALRARGARVTDIAVLVVAVDDGVKPQTIEAIDHAKAAKVPIVVALNKIDRPDADIDRVKQQLSKHELVPEDWGGKTVMVPTSAKENQGIKELLEMILLVAEVQELRADPKATPVGIVVESRLDKGKGPVADVLIKNGTLRVGDIFFSGATSGKVRALFNEHGQRLKEAGPSTPVEVLGASAIPKAGDLLKVVASEKSAKQLAEKNQQQQKSTLQRNVLSLEDFSKHVKEGERKNLNLVLKADVQGSVDAIKQSIQGLTVGNISINIIHAAVGSVNESDIMLALASGAVVVGFHVSFEGNAESVSAKEGVEVRLYDIIYKLIDDIKLAMEGMLEPEYEEVVIGHAEVRNLFKFSKVGVIAGCFVTDGRLARGAKMRIFRNEEKIHEGKLVSLKRFKDDVKAVEQNFECGVAIPGYSNFEAGDIVEAFEIREKSRKR
ncbi:translation initiation factor IF-2 [Candidatus Margulisiibacteriota bacterium]